MATKKATATAKKKGGAAPVTRTPAQIKAGAALVQLLMTQGESLREIMGDDAVTSEETQIKQDHADWLAGKKTEGAQRFAAVLANSSTHETLGKHAEARGEDNPFAGGDTDDILGAGDGWNDDDDSDGGEGEDDDERDSEEGGEDEDDKA